MGYACSVSRHVLITISTIVHFGWGSAAYAPANSVPVYLSDPNMNVILAITFVPQHITVMMICHVYMM